MDTQTKETPEYPEKTVGQGATIMASPSLCDEFRLPYDGPGKSKPVVQTLSSDKRSTDLASVRDVRYLT